MRVELKTKQLLAILASFTIIFAFTIWWSQRPPSDAQIRKRLVGAWAFESPGSQLSMRGLFTLAADGNFEFDGDLSVRGEIQPVRYDGSWWVTNGILATKILNSDFSLRKVGAVRTYRIVRLDRQELTYRAEDGRLVTAKRELAR